VVPDVAFPDKKKSTSFLKLVYQDSPLEEESRNSQTILKEA
jgi:hypothetical protein